jgi:hypothetical protein
MTLLDGVAGKPGLRVPGGGITLAPDGVLCSLLDQHFASVAEALAASLASLNVPWPLASGSRPAAREPKGIWRSGDPWPAAPSDGIDRPARGASGSIGGAGWGSSTSCFSV